MPAGVLKWWEEWERHPWDTFYIPTPWDHFVSRLVTVEAETLTNGIGGYDLKSPDDKVFAFDYDSSGKLDHLVLYTPGTGTIWILQKVVLAIGIRCSGR